MTPVTVAGLTVLPWRWPPNGGVLERLEWLTDVLTAFLGREQRIHLRSAPRQTYEFDVALRSNDRRRAESALHAWAGNIWALPVWMDSSRLSADASGVTLSLDTRHRQFKAGGLALLMHGDAVALVSIESFAPDSLTLTEPLAGHWPAGHTRVYPVRLSRLAEGNAFRRFTGDALYGRMRWETMTGVDEGVTTETPLYRDLPLLRQAPNWTEDIEQGLLRLRDSFDPGVAPVFTDDRGLAASTQSHRWTLEGRSTISEHRQFLFNRRGKLSAFWLPSFAMDLRVVAPLVSGSNRLDVANTGNADLMANTIGRRDLQIRLRDGTERLRRITSASVLNATTERLTLDSEIGIDAPAEAVACVSFLRPSRLDTDGIELQWRRHDVVECATLTRSLRDDV